MQKLHTGRLPQLRFIHVLIPIRIRGTCAEGSFCATISLRAKLPIKITYFLTTEPIFTPGAKNLQQQTPLIEIYESIYPSPFGSEGLVQKWVQYHFEQLSAHMQNYQYKSPILFVNREPNLDIGCQNVTPVVSFYRDPFTFTFASTFKFIPVPSST